MVLAGGEEDAANHSVRPSYTYSTLLYSKRREEKREKITIQWEVKREKKEKKSHCLG